MFLSHMCKFVHPHEEALFIKLMENERVENIDRSPTISTYRPYTTPDSAKKRKSQNKHQKKKHRKKGDNKNTSTFHSRHHETEQSDDYSAEHG